MKDCQQEINRLRAALELIAHATAPTHDDGSEHENAYTLASEALAIDSKPVLDALHSRFNTLDTERTTFANDAAYQKQKADFYADKAGKEDEQIYFWAGDGEDHPESLVSAVTVVIRASHLREIISARDEFKGKWEQFSNLDLCKELKSSDAINGALSKENIELRNAIASGAEQKPSWYLRAVHVGWPEWSDNNSFSDGEGGGEPYYALPVTHMGSLLTIREMYDVLRSIEIKHGAVWKLYKPDNYQRMMQRAEYWFSSPQNNTNKYVPIEFLKVANQNHEHFEREWYLRGQQLEELQLALENISVATSPDKEASTNFEDIHFTAIEALRVQKSEEDQSHARDPARGHSFTSVIDAGGFNDDCFDDICIKQFTQAMAAKMAISRAKGRGGWEKPDECSVEKIAKLLVTQLGKGDPVDIGNYAMMLFVRKAIPQVLTEAMESVRIDHVS